MVTAGLQHWWVFVLALAALVAAFLLGYLRRRPALGEARWVANAGYLTALPSFTRALGQYRRGLWGAVVLTLLAGTAAGVLAARPVQRESTNPELATRDIVLCLDVSGSMVGYDAEIVDTFLDLVEEFDGERIALSIWNQTSRTVFPLTDDYDLVREELAHAQDVLDFDVATLDDNTYDPEDLDSLIAFIAGTDGGSETDTSLIGDGLASCGLLFDEADAERSRTVILASDNQVIGEPVFSLEDSADFIDRRDINLVAIYGGEESLASEAARTEYETIVTSHGGLFFEAADPEAVPAILESVEQEQAVDLDVEPEVTITDAPAWPLAVLGGALLVLGGLLWRLRL
ncbi:vWA domain-containing protein [Serinibacter salmoneus]|uniref:Ca-activated chloride channel family protein n=1 Tax=Serinibacter salmoneus TaxID=556530 RepID=A0A2A9D327_9MICO|nr:vWA domain-containing protein [Serinibacter salmoneus]PFG21063.1 Ca-activated chloride channel family protein [Serinibacter salmoneus]